MNVKHFTLPAEAYPRYRYARDNVTSLLKRCKTIMTKCALEDPFTMPEFNDVHIYVISANTLDLISTVELTKKECKQIKSEVFNGISPHEFNQQTEGQVFVCVSSYEEANTNDKMWEYLREAAMLISEAIDPTMSPDVRSTDQTIVSVKPRSALATETDIVLERMVFKHLYPRVRVLKSFLILEQTPVVVATINPSIEKALSSRIKQKILLPPERNHEARLFRQWHEARLEVITTKVNETYDREDKKIKEQILQQVISHPSVAEVRPLTICEHILPYLVDTNETSSRTVPNSLLAKVSDLHIAFEFQKKADIILEKFTQNLDGVADNKHEIESLYNESMAMYKRSKVPEFERPRESLQKPTYLKEEVAKEIINVNGVTGCGYRFSTLDIYLKDSLTEKERKTTEGQLKSVIERNKIERYELRTEHKLMKLSSVGSRVSGKIEGPTATLGGFAKRGKSKVLCLLLARHFAENHTQLFVETNSGKEQIAVVLKPVNNAERGSMDISAADVTKKLQTKCSTQFKDQYGDSKESSLTEFEENEIDFLKYLPVHIWGAASSPGLGIIIIPDYYVPGMTGLEKLVKIEDRSSIESGPIAHFAQDGDSGSIVCANDPSGEKVHVISMLMGSVHLQSSSPDSQQKDQYLTFRLKDGLNQLQRERNGEVFEIC